jgi:hypothetical protein
MSQMLIPLLSQNPLALDVETGGINPVKHSRADPIIRPGLFAGGISARADAKSFRVQGR